MLRINAKNSYKIIASYIYNLNKPVFLRQTSLLSSVTNLQPDVLIQDLNKHDNNHIFDTDIKSFKNTELLRKRDDYSLLNDNLDKSFYELDVQVKKFGRLRKNELNDILKDIANKKIMTSMQALLLIRCCGDFMVEEHILERNKILDNIINLCQKLNVKFDISHLNSLLKIFCENKHFLALPNIKSFDKDINKDELAINILNDIFPNFKIIQNKDIQPSRITYQRLVSYFCESGDISKAEQVLEVMKAKDIPVNEAVFASLISAYGSLKDFENVISILSIMKQSELEPTSLIYTNIFKALVLENNLSELNKYLKESQENGVFLLNKDLLDVVFFAITQSKKYSNTKNDHISSCLSSSWEQVAECLVPYLKPHSDFMQSLINVTHKVLSFNGLDKDAYKMFKYFSYTVGQNLDPHFKFQNPMQNSGAFIIKHMLTQAFPPHEWEDLFEIITDMHNIGINIYAVQRALELHFNTDNFSLNQEYKKYMQLMNNLSVPVRPHYFWPILANLNSNYNYRTMDLIKKNLFDTLNYMKRDFGIWPTFQTLVDYVYPILDKIVDNNSKANRNSSTLGRKREKAIEDEDLKEAMDEDYEEETAQSKDHQPSGNQNKLTTIWRTFSNSTSVKDRKSSENTAINALLFYALNESNILSKNLNLNQVYELLSTVSMPLPSIESTILMHKLPQLYQRSLTIEGENEVAKSYEQMLGEILISNINEELSVIKIELPNLDIENIKVTPLNFDWNGKVLLDIFSNFQTSSKLSPTLQNRAIDSLLKTFSDLNLAVSRKVVDTITNKHLSDDFLTTLKKNPLKVLNELSLDTLPTTTTHGTPLVNRHFSDNLDRTMLYADTSTERLEQLLTRLTAVKDRNQDANQDNLRIRSLKRHLVMRYCRDRTDGNYKNNHSKIESLAQSLTIPPYTQADAAAFTLLIDFFARNGDGIKALSFKNLREIANDKSDFGFRNLSIPKTLEICTALAIQSLAGIDCEETRTDSILELLSEASIIPLSSQPFTLSNYSDSKKGSSQDSPYTPLDSYSKIDQNPGSVYNEISSENYGNNDKDRESAMGQQRYLNNNSNVSPRSNTEYQVWKLLSLASGGTNNLDDLGKKPVLKDFDKIFDATLNLLGLVIAPSGKSNPSPSILSTLINARLNQGDMKSALNEFHKFALEYRVTPHLTILLKKLIQNNDTDNLQKMVDVASEIHTEANTLIDLLFAFTDLGRYKEANKVLETTNMVYKFSRFDFYCLRYVKDNKVKELEYIVNATKNLKDINKDQMYYYLLKVYDKNDDHFSALKLWDRMLDDEDSNYYLLINNNVAISDLDPNQIHDDSTNKENRDVSYKYRLNNAKLKNLLLLAQILKKGDASKPLPFVIPATALNVDTTKNMTNNERMVGGPYGDNVMPQDIQKDREIIQLLNEGQIEKALMIKNRLKNNGKVLAPHTYSTLLENLIRIDDKIEEALALAKEMKQNHLFVSIPLVKSLLSKLSHLGRYDDIKQSIPALVNNPTSLFRLNIEKYVAYAYTNCGQYLTYLKQFEDNLDDYSKKNISPQGVLYAINKFPECFERIMSLAKAYAQKGQSYHLYNLIFTHYTLNNRFQEAKILYEDTLRPIYESNLENVNSTTLNPDSDLKDSSLKSSPVLINIITICKNAKGKNDDSSIKFLINDIGLNSSKSQLGLAFSFWISMKCHNSMYNDALALYDRAIKEHQLKTEHFRIFALRELKNCLTSQGKPVPFDLHQINTPNSFNEEKHEAEV
ncbi:unnamed protein product [Gordionus sp. m RMFG-2023]|uniref:leucine-rich PPR motif-containing protein, mitochondrial-like isoform X2 n=1 Tax=Gordionus sp. m RMFG-2023 TaxID=3053472 RepID=UPI0030DEF20B